MLYGAEVAVCSQINTKCMKKVWEDVQFLNIKPVGACNM